MNQEPVTSSPLYWFGNGLTPMIGTIPECDLDQLRQSSIWQTTFQTHFLNENSCMLIKTSLKSVHNKPSLISMMANAESWTRPYLNIPSALSDNGRSFFFSSQIRQVHLFMQEHEKRKPWQVIIPSKYQLTMMYTKCWLLLSHWDESILL